MSPEGLVNSREWDGKQNTRINSLKKTNENYIQNGTDNMNDADK